MGVDANPVDLVWLTSSTSVLDPPSIPLHHTGIRHTTEGLERASSSLTEASLPLSSI
jgi:hypothetical protein